jgi:hypothetical protein
VPDEEICNLHFTHSLGTLKLLGLLYKSIPVSGLHFSVLWLMCLLKVMDVLNMKSPWEADIVVSFLGACRQKCDS